MQELNIDIAEQKTSFRPGDKLAGTVRWNLPQNPESIEISLFWRTEGKGTQDVGVIETTKHATPGPLGQKDFAFTLPPAPYSFSGKLISIIWALEATVYPDDQTTRQQITISPTGQEVVLE
ncbi:MAG: hypothetical protein ISS79_11200 [Phycisphaerae bacterium]|nr:hypothetical protein [Phycisphaerae bacterium]